LTITATDIPDLTNVTQMDSAFFGCHEITTIPNLNNWDVSSVTDMSFMFFDASIFNDVVNNWDVSSVTDMSFMFAHTGFFNQPLNNWDVSNVTDMTAMFWHAHDFNGNISNW